MRRVLFVFPTEWDRRQLAACRDRWEDEYEVVFGEPADSDWCWDMDVLAEIDRLVEGWRGRVDGVTSSSDYPGAAVAAAVAGALGLPGSRPEAVVGCSHKFHCRRLQARVAPEAVPPFALLDPTRPPSSLDEVGFPCFVKPVKGSFSVQTRKVESIDELASFLRSPAVHEFLGWYTKVFDRLVRRWLGESHARFFLAEGLLRGEQVTVEGFVSGGEVEHLGIVDSVMHSGTRSFRRFDFPSALPAEVQARMASVVRRIVPAIGLSETMFNVELMYDPATGAAHVIEVNPRLCGQFADLYEKVDGTNGYLVALALATGRRPRLARGAGPCRVASSHPLRIFEPSRVVAAPDADRIAGAESLFPGTLVWNECAAGEEISDFTSVEDGRSRRYAVVNLGGADHAEREARIRTVIRDLGHRFEPIAGGAGPGGASA